MIERPTDREILASIAQTLRNDIFPALAPGWERSTVAQLVAIAEWAKARQGDPAAAREQAVVAALHTLRGNPIIVESSATEGSPWQLASAALVAAIGRTDDAAVEVQRALRPVLVAQLDNELAETTPMMDGFRGRLRDVPPVR